MVAGLIQTTDRRCRAPWPGRRGAAPGWAAPGASAPPRRTRATPCCTPASRRRADCVRRSAPRLRVEPDAATADAREPETTLVPGLVETGGTRRCCRRTCSAVATRARSGLRAASGEPALARLANVRNQASREGSVRTSNTERRAASSRSAPRGGERLADAAVGARRQPDARPRRPRERRAPHTSHAESRGRAHARRGAAQRLGRAARDAGEQPRAGVRGGRAHQDPDQGPARPPVPSPVRAHHRVRAQNGSDDAGRDDRGAKRSAGAEKHTHTTYDFERPACILPIIDMACGYWTARRTRCRSRRGRRTRDCAPRRSR